MTNDALWMRALVRITGQSAVDPDWNTKLIGNKTRVSTLEKLTDEPNYWVIVKEHEELLRQIK